MAIRDLKSNIINLLTVGANIPGDTITTLEPTQVQHYESGVMISLGAPAGDYADGTYTPKVQESDDNGALDPYTDIPEDRYIGTIADATITAGTTSGGQMKTLGLKWTKKWIRVVITATSVISGAYIVVITSVIPEIKPVS